MQIIARLHIPGQKFSMGIFKRCQITLEFDSTVNFKFKTALKKKIIDNDGIVSFIVTKRVNNSILV